MPVPKLGPFQERMQGYFLLLCTMCSQTTNIRYKSGSKMPAITLHGIHSTIAWNTLSRNKWDRKSHGPKITPMTFFILAITFNTCSCVYNRRKGLDDWRRLSELDSLQSSDNLNVKRDCATPKDIKNILNPTSSSQVLKASAGRWHTSADSKRSLDVLKIRKIDKTISVNYVTSSS